MKNRFNHNPNGNDVADEIVSLTGTDGAWDFLHDNIMQEKGISIYSGPNKSGQKITDYTITQDPAKPWRYSISFGGTVQPGDYYVSYSSLGDQVDANDINDLETGLANKADVGHKHVLADITDINTSGEQDGYALVYDAASKTYMAKPVTGGGGATNLAQLGDVDLTGNVDGDILVFDSASGKFKVSAPPTGGGASALSALTDVDVTDEQNGYALIYDAATTKWAPGPLPTGGGASLALENFSTEDVVLTDTVAPDDITKLYIAQTSPTSITIAFTESVSDDTSQYVVYNGATQLVIIPATKSKLTPIQYPITGLTSSTQYNLVIKTQDEYGNLSAGASITVSTDGTQALHFNADGYIQLPSIQFDRLDIDYAMDSGASVNKMILDARQGASGCYLGSTGNNTLGAGYFGYWEIDGYSDSSHQQSGLSGRHVATVGDTTPITAAVVLAANYQKSPSFIGKLYSCKLYLAGVLQASYNFTTQFSGTTVTDISGNGHDGTLSGGTWIAG